MIEVREASKSQAAEIASLIMTAMTDDCCLFIRIIEHSLEKLTLAELEALYYDMTTKSYIND